MQKPYGDDHVPASMHRCRRSCCCCSVDDALCSIIWKHHMNYICRYALYTNCMLLCICTQVCTPTCRFQPHWFDVASRYAQWGTHYLHAACTPIRPKTNNWCMRCCSGWNYSLLGLSFERMEAANEMIIIISISWWCSDECIQHKLCEWSSSNNVVWNLSCVQSNVLLHYNTMILLLTTISSLEIINSISFSNKIPLSAWTIWAYSRIVGFV